MDPTTERIQRLLDRLRNHEPGAIQELVALSHDRLRKLAAKMLMESFPSINGVREVDSIVSEAYIRLAKALETVDLPTPEDYFRFAAHKVRQTLLDMAEDAKRRRLVPLPTPGEGSSASGAGFDPGMTTLDPAQLAVWTEFHSRVGELPEEVQALFEQCYYLGHTQAQWAAATGEHPRKVSRLWFEATMLLKKYVPEEG
jgi:DNA-directed RNA polymerase specialized sigma24 family protein